MRSTGKRYTDDFKKMIIELYNSGKPVLELCSEYGITNPTLYKWIKNPPDNESKKPIVKVDNKSYLSFKKKMNALKRKTKY